MPAMLTLVGLAGLLAWANGSNDVSKGIATLVGSGVSSFRAAVLWGALWTIAGGLVAAFASQGLVATFSGKGFLASAIPGPAFLSAVAAGAIVWVFFASTTGLPVSTTHAIAGALAGAGVVAQGALRLHWSFLAERVALPLALSPLLSVALVYAIFPLLRRGVSRVETYCLCIERRVAISGAGALAMSGASAAAISSTLVSRVGDCEESPAVAARLDAVDALHWLSSAGNGRGESRRGIPGHGNAGQEGHPDLPSGRVLRELRHDPSRRLGLSRGATGLDHARLFGRHHRDRPAPGSGFCPLDDGTRHAGRLAGHSSCGGPRRSRRLRDPARADAITGAPCQAGLV